MSERGWGEDRGVFRRVALDVLVILVIFGGILGMLGYGLHRVLGGDDDSEIEARAESASGTPEVSDSTLQDLVERLADPDWEERGAAQRQLIEIGAPALVLLRQAIHHSDPEVVWRAEETIERIEIREKMDTP